jgi:hypothetical protein
LPPWSTCRTAATHRSTGSLKSKNEECPFTESLHGQSLHGFLDTRCSV